MIYANSEYEAPIWAQQKSIVGIDEVGRGAWAGPAVVGAVVFPQNFSPTYNLADSKLLSEKARNELAPQIQADAKLWLIEEVPVMRINDLGVGKAIQEAFFTVATNSCAEHILIDAFYINSIEKTQQTPIIKGDQKSISIAAASIIAKVYRDKIMRELHESSPEYGFDKNVGYGTSTHRNAIAQHGLSISHRTSYNLSKWL